jgi:ketosteroid isomerase-like protein
MTAAQWNARADKLIGDYIAAFNSNDGKIIAEMYNEPCVLLRGDGSIVVLASRPEIAAFFQPVADSLRRDGCRNWRSSNMVVQVLGKLSAIVTTDWEPLREDGTPIRKWRQSYNLAIAGGRPRILASTMHVEG